MRLAVDPALGTLGWACVEDDGSVCDAGVLVQLCRAQDLGVHADRERRIKVQSELLTSVVRRWSGRLHSIVAEQMSWRGPRVNMIASLCLSWGALTMLATCHGLAIRAVPAKTWQPAVAPAALSDGKVDYDVVFAALAAYVSDQAVAAQLDAIKPKHRNHTLDAIGIGVYDAMTLVSGRGAA